MTILSATSRVASYSLSKPSCLRFGLPQTQLRLAAQLGERSLANSVAHTRTVSPIFPPSPPQHIRPDTTAPVASFLESADDEEYNSFSHPTLSHARKEKEDSVSSATHETRLLLDLLARGQAQRALTIKREFEELGVPLSRHSAFTQAALDALKLYTASRRKGKGRHDLARQPHEHGHLSAQVEQFLAWWSLSDLSAPSSSASLPQSGWDAYAKAERTLLIRPFSFAVLSQFVLLSAQAGPWAFEYIRRGSTLRYLIYYGGVGESVAFLLKLEEAVCAPIRDTQSSEGWRTWLWQMAVDVQYEAKREEVVQQLLDFARQRGADIRHPSLHVQSFQVIADTVSPFAFNDTHTFVTEREGAQVVTQSTLNALDQRGCPKESRKLAKELQIIKRVLFPRGPSRIEQKAPKYFSSFVARFLVAYGHSERGKDVTIFIHRIRDMLFSPNKLPPPPTAAISRRERSAPYISVRALSHQSRIVPDSMKRIWLAAELRAFIAIDRPLAALKTLHYFVALDPTLASEVSQALVAVRRPRKRAMRRNGRKEEVDWKATQMPASYVHRRWISAPPQTRLATGVNSQFVSPNAGEECSSASVSGLDGRVGPAEVGHKLWPNGELLMLGWRALLKIVQAKGRQETRRRVMRLYMTFRSLARRSVEVASSGEMKVPPELLALANSKAKEDVLEKYLAPPVLSAASSPKSGAHQASAPPPPIYPSTILATPRHFHHFLVALCTSSSPRTGASVFSDMRHLGIDPGVQSWGALAGAYARGGDLKRCERSLDVVDGISSLETLGADTTKGVFPSPDGSTLQAPSNSDSAALKRISDEHVVNRSSCLQSEQTYPPITRTRQNMRRNRWTPIHAQKPSLPAIAAYNSSIRGLSESGCFSEAVQIVRRMMARGLASRETVQKLLGSQVLIAEDELPEDMGQIVSAARKKQKLDAHTRATLSRLAWYLRQAKSTSPSPSSASTIVSADPSTVPIAVSSTDPLSTKSRNSSPTSVSTSSVSHSEGPSPSALLRSKRRFYFVDGRRLFIDARRVEWLSEQGKRLEGFRGGSSKQAIRSKPVNNAKRRRNMG